MDYRDKQRLVVRMGLLAPLLFFACSGDDGDDDAPPPPPPPVTNLKVDASDPCTADVPTPTDLFTNDDGTTEQSGCPLPSDPLEAAMADAFRNMGAATDAEILIPVNGSLDPLSLSSTTTFALTGSNTGGPPPVVMIALTGSATAASGWEVVAADVRYVEPNITIRPRATLAEAQYHVVVTTNAMRDNEGMNGRVQTTPVFALLTGTEPITAASLEDLDAATAERLERERQRLQPALEILEAGSPPIPRDSITSIQGFTTDPGYGRFQRLVELYYDALDDGTYATGTTHATVPREDVFLGNPNDYPNVAEVHYGTVTAPRLLGDDGRIRPNWHLNAETIEIPFSFTVPTGEDRYPVLLFTPGYGRGRIDVRSIAQIASETGAAGVMALELRCHGNRSPELDGICGENRSAAEVDALLDAQPNNGNMQIQGADGIPDDSGQGYFPGDAVALRDSQMAAAIELLHVIRTLRNPSNFDGLQPNAGQIHIIAHGQTAPAAVLAVAETEYPTTNLTLSMPAGGGDYKSLVLDGPNALTDAWVASLPHGLLEAQGGAYFDFANDTLFRAIDLSVAGPRAADRLRNGQTLRRGLLSHGSVPTAVPVVARTALVDALGLPTNRVSQHAPQCDDFFLFPCPFGDNPLRQEESIRQMVVFVNSGGNTVTTPSP
ncbi:MAG: hypothetical protein RIT81_42325 [Deltaproteobacteria bacterium]